MTWDTPDGPRIVAGSEARLLKHAISAMLETYELDTQAGCDPAEYGVSLFDELGWTDRLALLEQVGQALLTPYSAAAAPCAVLDATVAALFNQILHEIEYEIESTQGKEAQQRRFWRNLVAQAFTDAFHQSTDVAQEGEERDDVASISSEQTLASPEPLPSWLNDSSSANDSTALDDFDYSYEGVEDSEYETATYSDWKPEPGAGDEAGDEEDEDTFLSEEAEQWLEDLPAEEVLDSSDDDDDDDDGSGWISIYDTPPVPDCRDMEVWYDVIDALTDRILADRDFDLADRFLDVPPSLAKELRETLGINRDYFVTPAPATRDSPSRLVEKVRELVSASSE